MKQLLMVGVFIISFVGNLTTFGATVLWNGSGDGVSWSDANNWSSNVPPAPSDDVIINGPGTNVTITVGNDVTVQSLQ